MKKAVFLTSILLLTVGAEAAIVNYNFTGSAGNEVVNGYFTLDTDVTPDFDQPPTAVYDAIGDSFLVDFGVTISLPGQDLNFLAQRAIRNQDPGVSTLGRVINDQLVGVNPQGQSIFNDSLSFTLLDQGIAQTPSNPLLSTVTTNDVVTYLYNARIDVAGASHLVDSRAIPSSIDFSAATRATLFVQVGSAVFDPNLGRYVSVGDSSATYHLTDISVQAIPVPPAVWLFGSALLGLAGIGRKRGIKNQAVA